MVPGLRLLFDLEIEFGTREVAVPTDVSFCPNCWVCEHSSGSGDLGMVL